MHANKRFFPYVWMTSLHKFDSETLPPNEAFHTDDITEENYEYCQNV